MSEPGSPAPSASGGHRPSEPRGRDTGLGGGTVFRIRGIPVRIDISILLIGYIVVVQVVPRLQRAFGGDTVSAYVGAAAVALLLICSILGHELGHAFMSLARGIGVRRISLFALGGLTESTRESANARDEFLIVGIGPFTSLMLAGGFWVLALAARPLGTAPALVLGYAGWLNLFLAIFNTVPAYPLDGGRLLRSILWAVTGRPHQATAWAARVGQGFALVLAALALGPYVGVFDTILGPSVFNAVIAFFLFRGASAAHGQATARERLASVSAGEVMGSLPPVLDPARSVREGIVAVQDRPSVLWPVGDPVLGAVALGQLEQVRDAERDRLRLGDVAMRGLTVPTTLDADTLVARLRDAPGNMLVVVDERGRGVGLLTPSLLGGT